MPKKEKVAALAKAMTTSKRKDEEEVFYHFADEAPKELVDLYLEHYEVRDIDYQIFSDACDIVEAVYSENEGIGDEEARDEIQERSGDQASVYTSTQLSYLNIWNQSDIAEIVREVEGDIGNACAIWYDRQVEEAALIINDWVNA